MTQNKIDVRWSTRPVDSADEDNNLHPELKHVRVIKRTTSYPTNGRGVEWSRGVTTEVAWEVGVADIRGLVNELVDTLSYYADGRRDRDRVIEARHEADEQGAERPSDAVRWTSQGWVAVDK